MQSPALTQGLISGLGPITIAAIAFTLRRADDRLAWRWLFFFALGQGLREWLGALPGSWATAGAVVILRSVVSAASFVALMEFARLGLAGPSRRALPRWVIAAVALPIVAGTHQGFFFGSLEWTLLLSLIAGGGAALAIWRAGGEEAPLVRRWLRLSALAVGVYAVMAGLGADLWHLRAARDTTIALLRIALIFSGPVLREIVGLATAALLLVFSLWRDSVGEHGVTRWRGTLGVAGATGLLLVIIIGTLLRNPLETQLAHHRIPATAILSLGVSGASFGLWVGLLASWRAATQWANWTRRQSRNLLTSITESVEGGLLAVDGSGRVLYQNATFSELWGIPAGFMQEGEARILFGFLRERLEEPEAFTALIERALAVPERIDEGLRLKDGRVFRCRTNPLPGESGVTGRVLSFLEITELTQLETERQVREARRETQNEALTALAQRLTQSAPGGRATALREICEVAASTLEVGRVSVWLRDAESESLHCAEHCERIRGDAAETAAERLAAYETLWPSLPPERAAVIDDARDDARLREALEDQPLLRDITSLLQLPIESGTRAVGAVAFVHVGVPRRWTPDEQRFASALAALCSAALERFRRQQRDDELHQALEFQKLLAETAGSAICQLDAEGRIVAVNSALCRATGHLPEDLIGKPVSILGAGACGDECQLLSGNLEEPLRRHPCWVSDRDGTRLDVVRNATAIVDVEGRRTGTIVSFIDMSEAAEAQRQADEALQTSQQLQASFKTAQGRIETLERELMGLRGGLEGRDRERSETHERIRALEEALGETQEELGRAQGARDTAQTAETEARREAQAFRAERDALQVKLATIDGEQKAAHGEIENARREMAAAREETLQARNELKAKEQELEAVRAEAIRIQAQVTEAQEERRTPERELVRANTELVRVRTELGSTREEASSIRHQAESTFQELHAARLESEAARTEAAALSRQLIQLQGENDRLKTETESARGQVRAAEAVSAQAEKRAAQARAAEKKTADEARAVAEKRAADEARVAAEKRGAEEARAMAARRAVPPAAAARGKPLAPRRVAPLRVPPAPEPRPAAPPAVDVTALLASVGGDQDLATRRLRAFQKGAPWMLSRLRQAFVKKNALGLVSAAEAIRQAAADLCAGEVIRRAEQLEELARAGDLVKLDAALSSLEAEVERVRAALSSLPRAA
jgi:PAS domain S-box-containing protein